MEDMTTLSQVMEILKNRGYTIDFNLCSGDPGSPSSVLAANTELFVIDHFYRFEGDTDPEDEAILYAISTIDKSLMGVFVNGYGNSAESGRAELIEKLDKRPEHG